MYSHHFNYRYYSLKKLMLQQVMRVTWHAVQIVKKIYWSCINNKGTRHVHALSEQKLHKDVGIRSFVLHRFPHRRGVHSCVSCRGNQFSSILNLRFLSQWTQCSYTAPSPRYRLHQWNTDGLLFQTIFLQWTLRHQIIFYQLWQPAYILVVYNSLAIHQYSSSYLLLSCTL